MAFFNELQEHFTREIANYLKSRVYRYILGFKARAYLKNLASLSVGSLAKLYYRDKSLDIQMSQKRKKKS